MPTWQPLAPTHPEELPTGKGAPQKYFDSTIHERLRVDYGGIPQGGTYLPAMATKNKFTDIHGEGGNNETRICKEKKTCAKSVRISTYWVRKRECSAAIL